MWGTIQQLWMHLLKHWKWQTTLNCKIPSLPDILQVLLDKFVSVAWRTALKSMVLGLPCLINKVLVTHQKFLNHLDIVPWLTAPFAQEMFLVAFFGIMAQFKLVKHKFLIYIACSSVWLSNHTQTEVMYMCQCSNYHDTTNHSRYLL